MSLIKKTKKNLYFISLLSLIDRVVSFALIVGMARYLGAESYGLYAFAFAIASFASILADWGINSLLTRDLSANIEKKERYLATALSVKIPATVFALVALMVAAWLMPSLRESAQVILLVSLGQLLRILAATFTVVSRASLEMRYEAYAGILNRMLALIGGITAMVLGYGLITVLWVFLLASAIELIYSIHIINTRFARVRLVVNLSEQKKMVIAAVPFLMLISLPVVNYRFDSILLGFMDTKAATGIYNAAYVLILNFLIVSQIAGRILLPVFSRFEAEHKTVLEKSFRDATKALLVLALFAVLAVQGFAGEIIRIIYGPEFAESVKCLQILIFAVAFMLPSHIISTTLIALKKEKQVVIGWLATVIVNIVLNVILIPKYSDIGACIATVVSEFALLAVNYYHLVFNNHYAFFQGREWVRLSIPFSAGLLFLSVSNGLSVLMAAPLLVIIYTLFLFMGRIFSKEELHRLARLITP